MKALELKNTEFNAQGVEMNQRYESSAVLPELNAAPEEWKRDRGLYLQATTRPGAKIPHAWLVDRGGKRVSTLDVVGRGRMSLVYRATIRMRKDHGARRACCSCLSLASFSFPSFELRLTSNPGGRLRLGVFSSLRPCGDRA